MTDNNEVNAESHQSLLGRGRGRRRACRERGRVSVHLLGLLSLLLLLHPVGIVLGVRLPLVSVTALLATSPSPTSVASVVLLLAAIGHLASSRVEAGFLLLLVLEVHVQQAGHARLLRPIVLLREGWSAAVAAAIVRTSARVPT